MDKFLRDALTWLFPIHEDRMLLLFEKLQSKLVRFFTNCLYQVESCIIHRPVRVNNVTYLDFYETVNKFVYNKCANHLKLLFTTLKKVKITFSSSK